MDTSTPVHHKMWAEALVICLAAADDPHLWYDRVTDDLYCMYMSSDDCLVQIFRDVFKFSDSMIFVALGKGAEEAIATMDMMNDLLTHVMYRLEHTYSYDYVDVIEVARKHSIPVE